MNISSMELSPSIRASFDERLVLFDKIRIQHPVIAETRHSLESLIRQTNGKIRNTVPKPYWDVTTESGAELWLMPIVGPSGSTKTTTIEMVLDSMYGRSVDQSNVPIRYIKLNSSIKSTRQLQVRILESLSKDEALEVATSKRYTELKANSRLRTLSRQKGISLIILDEAHKILRSTSAEVMACGLHSIINHGVCSIVLMGTDKIRPVYMDEELSSRVLNPLELGPPKHADAASCVRLFQFAEELCAEMHKLGVTDRLFRPTSTVAQCAALYDITGGVLGQVSRHFRRALEYAHRLNLGTLDWSSIESSFSRWQSLPDAPASYDPFRKGPRASTAAAIKSIRDAMMS